MNDNYLMIENPGVCPPEGFTLLGASTKVGSDYIGQFGSGNKHSICLLLRNNIAPIVFSSKLKMEFSSKNQSVSDSIDSTEFGRVVVKYSGKQEDGKTNNRTEDLGFVMEYGTCDWKDVSLAMREFVSNAIDHAIKHNRHHSDKHPEWDGVDVSIVGKNQVRAKAGFTRVFIPLSDEVFKFYNNISKWFLQFEGPEAVKDKILNKRGRNIEGRGPVVYRRGVRVREVNSSPSVFDYNVEVTLDESRQASDFSVRHEISKTIINAPVEKIVELLEASLSHDKLFEKELDPWSFDYHTDEAKNNWKKAAEIAFGDNYVVCQDESQSVKCSKKGYRSVVFNEEFHNCITKLGVRKVSEVLSKEEELGHTVLPPSADTVELFNRVWGWLEDCGQTYGKNKPELHEFATQSQGGTVICGYFKPAGDTNLPGVYINRDFVGKSLDLTGTMVEELGHYITGAKDESLDFQNFFIKTVAKSIEKELSHV